jgi:hypothetical protein
MGLEIFADSAIRYRMAENIHSHPFGVIFLNFKQDWRDIERSVASVISPLSGTDSYQVGVGIARTRTMVGADIERLAKLRLASCSASPSTRKTKDHRPSPIKKLRVSDPTLQGIFSPDPSQFTYPVCKHLHHEEPSRPYDRCPTISIMAPSLLAHICATGFLVYPHTCSHTHRPDVVYPFLP